MRNAEEGGRRPGSGLVSEAKPGYQSVSTTGEYMPLAFIHSTHRIRTLLTEDVLYLFSLQTWPVRASYTLAPCARAVLPSCRFDKGI